MQLKKDIITLEKKLPKQLITTKKTQVNNAYREIKSVSLYIYHFQYS